jgi:hypothetical protein
MRKVLWTIPKLSRRTTALNLNLSARFAIAIGLLGLLCLTVPGSLRADTITLDFSGTVDLSGVGGAASNTFSGSVTWDPSTASYFHGSDGLGGSFAQFTPVAYGFTLNSTDESAHLILPSVNIFDNDSGVQDVYTFSFDILPALFEGIDTALYSFNGDLVGPTTMFSAAALPGNLDFLSAVTASSSYWLTTTIPYEDDKPTSTTVGTFIATGPLTSGVPEPSSLVLLAVSLACMLFLMTRKRIAHGCPQST